MGLFSPSDKPSLTEKNLPDQSGKVFLVTGSNAGVGKLLAGILYQHNAKVYIATRSAEKASQAIKELQAKHPTSKGQLIFLKVDFADLSGIKASAEEFLAKESRLDVLWNNAGVMAPPRGSKSVQGHELQLGVNNLGPFLFTKLLTPLLIETAKSAPKGSVRVVWVSSSAAKNFAPQGGVELGNIDYQKDKGTWFKYGTSKAGNIFQGKEFARRYRDSGVISVSVDPGFLKTDLYQHMPGYQRFFTNLILHDPIFGAYTELFGGLSPTVTMEDNGTFIEPWGKIVKARKDIEDATGEGSNAAAFWDWNERETARYV